VQFLFRDLLITVTSFFRDPEAFKVLNDKVINEIVAHKETGGAIRVWVPGCASGEEAISLAILLTEARERLGKAVSIQVFATDIDDAAIGRARQAQFPESIAADVSPERLKIFFTKNDNVYKPKQEIREMVVFATPNLIGDPPFSKLDLISCRNILIYLGAELQKKIIPLFHFVLNQEGHLFLGSSESIGGFADLFRPLDSKWKIYRRKDLGLGQRAEYPPLFALEGQLAAPRQRQLLEEIVPQNTVFEDFEVGHDFPVIGVRTMILNARRLEAQPGHPALILLAMEDVTKLT